MLDAKAAAEAAMKHFADLMGSGPANLSLEEIEWSEDDKHWLVTLGYNEASGLGLGYRKFKILSVEAETGRVLSMKTRTIQ
jgi:hypothetical protein